MLAVDVTLLVVALAAVGLFLHRRYRRFGRLLRFSLGEMLVVVTVTALACGWVSLRYQQWRLERQTFVSFPYGRFSTRDEYRGPEWLRRLLPGERLMIFNRAVEVSVNETWTDDATIASLVRLLTNAPYIHKLYSRATLVSRFTQPAPFANIDDVCLYSDGTSDDIYQALVPIAGWPQVRRLAIEVEERHAFSSRFWPTPPGMPASQRGAYRDKLYREELMRSLGSHSRWSSPPQTNLTDAAMATLAEMPALRYLALANCPDVTSDGICRLAKSTSLVGVAIPDAPDISDDALKLLAKQVKDLYLIQPEGGSHRFDSDKSTTIGADELLGDFDVEKKQTPAL